MYWSLGASESPDSTVGDLPEPFSPVGTEPISEERNEQKVWGHCFILGRVTTPHGGHPLVTARMGKRMPPKDLSVAWQEAEGREKASVSGERLGW